MYIIKKGQDAGLRYASYESVLGDIFVLSSHRGIAAIGLGLGEEAFLVRSLKDYGIMPDKTTEGFSKVFSFFDDYFSCKEGRAIDFMLDLKDAGTPFDQGVWQVLRTIPYNQCRSYSWVAEQASRMAEANGLPRSSPKAFRAVGRACGANRLPIIIPCHRVILASGKIGGFAEAAGGLEMKKRLLELEGRDTAC